MESGGNHGGQVKSQSDQVTVGTSYANLCKCLNIFTSFYLRVVVLARILDF